jgi:hypothetical protein
MVSLTMQARSLKQRSHALQERLHEVRAAEPGHEATS